MVMMLGGPVTHECRSGLQCDFDKRICVKGIENVSVDM